MRHHWIKEIGFWSDSPRDAGKPWPWPGDSVSLTWDHAERDVVVAYLNDPKHHRTAFFGYAHCRLCSKHDNGVHDVDDHVWLWPSGYAHYLTAHLVKPPQDFIDYVMRQVRR